MKVTPNKIFGRWTVLSRGPNDNRKHDQWNCRCECGTERLVLGERLYNGASKSCGCYVSDRMKSLTGSKHPRWKGGIGHNHEGYLIRTCGPNKGRAIHREIMEEKLGRKLLPEETIHHKNGVRDDNRLENLELKAGSHGMGQSIPDLLTWADEIVSRYRPLDATFNIWAIA